MTQTDLMVWTPRTVPNGLKARASSMFTNRREYVSRRRRDHRSALIEHGERPVGQLRTGAGEVYTSNTLDPARRCALGLLPWGRRVLL
jgi:hypothetical protein